MKMPSGRRANSRARLGLAHRERKVTQVVAVQRQHVERAELHFFIVLAGVQCVKIGDAVDAKDDGLAIDHEVRLVLFFSAASTMRG